MLKDDLILTDETESVIHPSGTSSDGVDALIKEMENLPEDLILSLLKETQIEHKQTGIDNSYNGNVQSDERIQELLKEVQVPLEVKSETNQNMNYLQIHNYDEFLLLQSRLTGVPISTLANGLKVYEDETIITPDRKPEEFQFDEDQEVVYELDDTDEEVDEIVEGEAIISIAKTEDDNLGVRFSLNDSGKFTEIPLGSGDDFNLEENLYTGEKEGDGYKIKYKDLPVTDKQVSQDIEIEEIDIMDDSDEIIIEEDILIEDEEFSIPTGEDEVLPEVEEEEEEFTVAPIDKVKFKANTGRVNSSKTYSLKQIDSGGNYNV